MINCEFEKGNKTSLRHVVVGAIVSDNNKILLIKRAPHLICGGMYGIPGGFLDRDEDTKTAAIRELKEETGYIGLSPQLFKVNDNPNRPGEDRQNVEFVYIVQLNSGEMTENSEVSEIKWFDFDNLPDEKEFAFDHWKTIHTYFQYLKHPRQLPIIG